MLEKTWVEIYVMKHRLPEMPHSSIISLFFPAGPESGSYVMLRVLLQHCCMLHVADSCNKSIDTAVLINFLAIKYV